MSDGFKGFAKPADDKEFRLYIKNKEVNKIIKEYKKLKKYQKSSLFAIKTMDGTEKIVSSLIKEAEENPL